MRLPTWNKPHILYCYEFSPKYIGLPVGCLDGLVSVPDFSILLIMKTFSQQTSEDLPENLKEDGLVAAILRLQVPRAENWDWKEDYAMALEKKYENIYRR